MIRVAAFILLAWGLSALVGALGQVFSLTLVLPATTAILVAQLAFSPRVPMPIVVGTSVVAGYLEDLEQGAPVGTLALSYGLCGLALTWLAARLAVRGWVTRALLAGLAAAVVDLLTFGVLWSLAGPLSVYRPALIASLWDARWHVLATMLAAPPVWGLADRYFGALGLPVATPASPGAAGGERP